MAHDDRAHRNFLQLQRALRSAQSLLHEEFIGVFGAR